ncbi:MAG: gluconeogenesis factor YvcK family protein [Candidatus Spechtbacterales bacterium]
MLKRKNIVVIGGGTGTSVVLEGLKKYPVNLSAIITTADDGSSSGKLRKEFNMIPPGDIRQCLVALASRDFGYLNERFQQGSLAGHTLGNLLITLFCQKNKDFQQAIDELLKITGAAGSLIPMTLVPTTLVAKLRDGRVLRGEKNITPSREILTKLARISLAPRDIKANPRAALAIKNADIIIVGPGNLFSSIIPNFLVKEISAEFRKAKARKIYVANLFAQPGHTDGFSVSDFVKTLAIHIGEDAFTHVVYNNRSIPEFLLKAHGNAIVAAPVRVTGEFKKDKRYVGRALASSSPRRIPASDPIASIRNPFLHDSKKLAKVIMELCE